MSAFRVVLLFVFISLLGYVCAPFLSLSFTPQVSSNSFTISYAFPGMPPLTVEREVTSVVENTLSGLQGLKSISSVSRHGSGYVQLTFEAGEDMAFRQQEIYMHLRQLALPREVGRPTVKRQAQNEKANDPILIYELRYNPDQKEEIDRAVNQLFIPRVASMEGVSDLVASGMPLRSVRVAYVPERLRALDLTPQQLQARIAQFTSDQSLVQVRKNEQFLTLQVRSAIESPEELERAWLSANLRLGDVAEVDWYEPPAERLLRINGKEAVFLSVFASSDANRLNLANEVRSKVNELAGFLPSGVELTLQMDDTVYLKDELYKAGVRSGLAFLFIALFGLIGYRQWRFLVLLGTSILINIGLVSLLAYFLSIEIHLYTLAGIAISFGLVVDNSIITIDANRKTETGKTLRAQLAASGTTIAALAVVLFLPRELRNDLTELVLIVCVALGTSFLVSWWFIPACATLLHVYASTKMKVAALRRRVKWQTKYSFWLHWLTSHRKWVIGLLILGFGLPVYLLPSKIDGVEWYNQTVGSEVYQNDIRPHVDKWLGGSSRLFYRNVYERSQYRTPDKTRLYVNARLPYGHTIEHMDHTLKKVEEYLLEFPEIEKFITQVHSGRQGSISIEFKPAYEQGGFPYILKNKLTTRSIDWGGVEWSVYGVGRGFSNATGDALPNFQITLKGYDYDRLGEIADDIKARLIKHPRIQKVETDARSSWRDDTFSRLVFRADSSRQSNYHSAVSNLRMLGADLNAAGQIQLAGRLYPLHLGAASGENLSLYKASEWADEGNSLKQAGDIQWEKSSNTIYREERQYVRTVSFDYYGSHKFGDKYLDEVLEEAKLTFPLGYEATKQTWTWGVEQEHRRYGMLLIAGLLILVVGIIYTERIKDALRILLVIPCAFIGLFLTFGWGGFYFDQGGYAAFLFLTGLSVNALLFVLADQRNLARRGNRAILKALSLKAWPILLTVVSTCVGFIPFLIFGESEVFWFSLAIGTIGGLVVSFILTFLVLPVVWMKKVI